MKHFIGRDGTVYNRECDRLFFERIESGQSEIEALQGLRIFSPNEFTKTPQYKKQEAERIAREKEVQLAGAGKISEQEQRILSTLKVRL